MANLYKLLAVGHPGTNDAQKVEPLVAAGLGNHAHIGIPQGAEAEIINRSQAVESHVRLVGEPIRVVHLPIHNVLQASGNTWHTIEKKVQPLEHIVIPWLE